MALRTGHGKGAGVPRIEVMPADELPAGVPAPASQAADRDDGGRLLPGPGTAELARKGAKARHESRQLAKLLGLWQPEEGHTHAPYRRLAEEWRDSLMAQLAATVGGGEVDSGTTSIASTAALQLGASRFLFDLGAQLGDAKILLEASRLADASRQNTLAAFELCARMAQARPTQRQDRLAAAAERSRQRRAALLGPAEPATTETTSASSASETRSQGRSGPSNGGAS